MPPLAPDLPELSEHFEGLHSGCSSAALDPEVAAAIANAEICPFTAEEVKAALDKMQRGKSAGLGQY